VNSTALDTLPTNAIAIDSRGTAPANRFHARESRIGFIASKQTDFGLANVQVEADFFGSLGNQLVSNSENFRLRHAKVEIGPLLAGQFWGTFSDPSSIAETLDFQGAPGYTFIRQAQIRYTHTFSKGVTLAFAAENPETSIVVNNNIAPIAGVNQNVTVVQTRDNNIPDFVIRGRVEDSWGHVQLGLLLRSISGENFAGGNLLPTLAIGSNPNIAPHRYGSRQWLWGRRQHPCENQSSRSRLEGIGTYRFHRFPVPLRFRPWPLSSGLGWREWRSHDQSDHRAA